MGGAPFSGRNTLQLRPIAGGGQALVKLTAAPAAALKREAAVLQTLTLNALRFRVPRVVGFSARAGALAIGWVPRAQSLFARALPPKLGADLGRALASLHASPLGALPHASAAGDFVRSLAWPTAGHYATLNPASVALLAQVQSAPGAMHALVALSEAADGAHGLHPVHGDVRHPNLLRVGKNWLFVDWEMGGGGDPAADLGSAIAEAVGAWVVPRSTGERLTEVAMRRWLRALCNGYGATDQRFSERAFSWAGEAMLRRASSQAHYEARLDTHAIDIGLALLIRPRASMRQLLGPNG